MTIRALPQPPLTAKLPAVRSEATDRAVERWNAGVRAAREDDNSISILDVIGEDFWGEGVTAKRIAAALRSIGDRDVVVNINSPGGDVFEGLAIYNLLREHEGRVTVKVLGLAASAASVIAMAGDDVQIARAGFLMIHNTWVFAAGDRNALREAADMLEPFDGALADIYAARSGADEGEIKVMLDKETWLGGAEAVERGFADGFLPSDAVSESKTTKASIRQKFDALAKDAGRSRSEARALAREMKEYFAKPGAGEEGTPRAAEVEAAGLDQLRLAAARLSLLRA